MNALIERKCGPLSTVLTYWLKSERSHGTSSRLKIRKPASAPSASRSAANAAIASGWQSDSYSLETISRVQWRFEASAISQRRLRGVTPSTMGPKP
jgi:hypothetical protein